MRAIFIRSAVVASKTCQLVQNYEKIWTYSNSRSSKVDNFGTNWKRICNFYWSLTVTLVLCDLLAQNCVFFIPLAYLAPPVLFPLESRGKLTVRKLESWSYSVVKVANPNFNRFWLMHRVTHRRTEGMDRQTGDSIQSAIAYAVVH